jgi:hypothetical protein
VPLCAEPVAVPFARAAPAVDGRSGAENTDSGGWGEMAAEDESEDRSWAAAEAALSSSRTLASSSWTYLSEVGWSESDQKECLVPERARLTRDALDADFGVRVAALLVVLPARRARLGAVALSPEQSTGQQLDSRKRYSWTSPDLGPPFPTGH